MVTYGDGVGNINIKKLLDFHKSHGKIATVTGVRPPSLFGELQVKDNKAAIILRKAPDLDRAYQRRLLCVQPETIRIPD